jgi:hypothetical protein
MRLWLVIFGVVERYTAHNQTVMLSLQKHDSL